MTIGSGAWADRLDALLRDRRELFEAHDRASIESFLETHDTSPLTNEPLATKSLTPNDALRFRLRERATTL